MRSTESPRMSGDDGAAMVEFALVAPFFFAVVFGIIEFGWMFGQHLSVRHAAREGARLVAVDYEGDQATAALQLDELRDTICARMDDVAGATITFGLESSPPASDPPATDDVAVLTIDAPAQTITGFFDSFLGSTTLSTEVHSRIEVDAHWIESPWTDAQRTCV